MPPNLLGRRWPKGTPQGAEKSLKRSGNIVIYAFSIKFSTKIRIKFEKQEKNEKTDKKSAPDGAGEYIRAPVEGKRTILLCAVTAQKLTRGRRVCLA